MNFDTVVAIATAPGEGAIGIVRISGDESVNIIKSIFVPKGKKEIEAYGDKRMIYGHIVDGEEIVDEVLVTVMYGPNTYTREDIVEINCHGGIVPMKRTVELVLKHGAEMAEPGEFTKRAFLNGRLDLAQAESIMDLISAKTKKGFDVAYNQLEGHLSQKVSEIRGNILENLSHIQVNIDYPDEDIEEITYEELHHHFNMIEKKIKLLLDSSETGRIIREGLSTVIVGKPNVGKSSLLNALLKEARAIVTDIPGTTRDVIEEFINIDGIPLKIIDTAGIRETEDQVEKIGVERSKAFFNKADLVMLVLNASEPLSVEDREIIEILEDKKALIIINKTDLEQKIEMDELEKLLKDQMIIKTSITGEIGINDVEKSISSMVYSGDVTSGDNTFVSNIRHKAALENAYQSVKDANQSIEQGMALDFIEVDVKNAYDYLGEILGETVEEDIVNKIFSNFCLGK